jgi:oligopeptidase B
VNSPLRPPAAKIARRETTLFGDTRVDHYYWLRDRSDPDTLRYLEAENAYTAEVMRPTEALQAELYQEMVGRIQETDQSAPVPRDGFFYYTRTEAGKQYSIYCRKRGSLDAPEEILLDGNVLAEGQTYFRIGDLSVSPDHRLLAYSTDLVGDESYTVRVKDLATGQLLADEIVNVYYSLEWANDNATLFYTRLDAAHRPYKVFRHRLGAAEDAEVYHEADERFTVAVMKTASRAFILIGIHSSLTSEIRYLDANQPEGPLRIVLPRVHEVEYDLTHRGDSFFIRTSDGAKTFRVVQAPVANPSKENWVEFLPAREGVTVEGVRAFRDHLVIEERDQGLIRLRIHDFATGTAHYVPFDEPVYYAELGDNPEFATSVVRYRYTSLVTPDSIYDYEMNTRRRELKKRLPVLGGYDPAQYVSERIHAAAPDGVRVPISLVYRRGTARDGRSPAVLNGYGAYGASNDPVFASDRLSLINRGFIYAIAHVRGGGDLGKPWHEDGRLLRKKNTFTDFIACAEHLIAQRYTAPDRLAITGGSAGGLLIGAVLNMRPDLFAAAVTRVPFVDVLNTELDPTLPLTVGEWEEWGNPAEEQYYCYIKSYAPYECVRPQRYPHLLVTAGLNDPRVPYWEPAKWVARLRACKTDDNILLLKTDMSVGHFGKSGRYEYLKETAFNYAFLLHFVPHRTR